MYYYDKTNVRQVDDMWTSTATLENTIFVVNENADILKEILDRIKRIEDHLGLENEENKR